MKQVRTLFMLGVITSILASCSVSQNTVGGGMIQKRKYTKGFYVSRKSSIKGDDSRVSHELSVASEDQQMVNTVEEEATVNLASTQQQPENEVANANAIAVIEDQVVTEPQTATVSVREESPERTAPAVTTVSEEQTARTPVFGQKKAMIKAISNSAAASDPVMLILLVILALIIPPLAVAIYEGITTRFWIDLILAIVGIGVGFWLFGGGLAWICALAAVIYALLIVLEVI